MGDREADRPVTPGPTTEQPIDPVAETATPDKAHGDLIHRAARLITGTFDLAEAEATVMYGAGQRFVLQAALSVCAVVAAVVAVALVGVGIFLAVKTSASIVAAWLTIAALAAVTAGVLLLASRALHKPARPRRGHP